MGGGDECEDIAGALLRAVRDCNWSGDARFLLLLTDAPAHGARFNSGRSHDNHRHREQQSVNDFETAFALASERDVRILHCACDSNATEKMHHEMEQFARAAEEKKLEGANMISDRSKAIEAATRVRLHQIPLSSDSGPDKSSQPCLHVVLCLDESGSMNGDPFAAMIRAVQEMWSNLQDAGGQGGGNDVASIIMFGSSSRIFEQRRPIVNGCPSINQISSGTCFMPPLNEVDSILSRSGANETKVLVFLSDGESGDENEAVSKCENLRSKFRGLETHMIAFGSGAGQNALKKMAGNPNHFHNANDAFKLKSVFSDLAEGFSDKMSSVTNRLKDSIAKEVAALVTNRLVADFL